MIKIDFKLRFPSLYVQVHMVKPEPILKSQVRSVPGHLSRAQSGGRHRLRYSCSYSYLYCLSDALLVRRCGAQASARGWRRRCATSTRRRTCTRWRLRRVGSRATRRCSTTTPRSVSPRSTSTRLVPLAPLLSPLLFPPPETDCSSLMLVAYWTRSTSQHFVASLKLLLYCLLL